MSNPLNLRAKRRERDRQTRLAALGTQRTVLRQSYYGAADLAAEVEQIVAAELISNAADLAAEIDQSIRPELARWTLDAWSSWQPDTTTSLGEVRVGSMVASDGTDLGVPIVVDLDSLTGGVVIVSRSPDERALARELLGSLVVRLTACAPKQLRLTLLDPLDLGAAFPMSRRLERVVLGFEDPHFALDEIRADIERISSTYLDRRHPDFASLPATLRLGESRQAVLASALPHGYDSDAIEALVRIAADGGRAGVTTIVHVDHDGSDRAANTLERFVALGATVLEVGGTPAVAEWVTGTVAFDECPSGALQELVYQRVAAAPRRDVTLPWDSVQEPDPDGFWAEPSDHLVSASVGRAGADDVYEIWFGHDPETSRTCTHGIVVGGAPTGRQFVFDNLLAGLASRVSPEQLRFVLVDSHQHSAFAAWKAAPHTELVALEPSPAQARSALAAIRSICQQRDQELQRSGHAHYQARRHDAAAPTMPRLLAIIDGFDQLFEHDPTESAIADLQAVIALGERTGVHLLLGASRFDAAAPLHRAGLFGQLDVRISLQLFDDDKLGRDEFGVKGARLVQRVCDRPFRCVVNTTRGHDDANIAMQLAAIDPSRRDALIAQFGELARTRHVSTRSTHVINGREQPQLIDNQHLQHLLELPRTPEAVAEFVRSSTANGGLGIDDWVDEEHPLLMFVGQEDTLHGQAHFVLRRRPTENVLVLMSDRNLRMGTLAALMVSSALVDPDDVEFWISDRGPTGTPAGEALEQAVRRIARLDIPCRYTRSGDESAEYIANVAGEVARRRALSESELHRQPTAFLVLVDPERVAALNRVPTEHGTTDSELGVQLRYVLMQGPAVGVHAVITSSAMAALSTVIAEPVIHHDLRHRLVTRVAEEDSFALVRSSRAATLSAGNGHAAAALLFDSHDQSTVTFQPYSVAGSESGRVGPMSSQLGALFDKLTEEVQA